jgi:hypothetical protein
MNPASVETILRSEEITGLAELLFAQVDVHPVTGEARQRLAAGDAGRFEKITPHWGALAADPAYPRAYFLPVDGVNGRTWLLRLADAEAPPSGYFPQSLRIGRVPLAGAAAGRGATVVVDATPFSSGDWDAVRTFASEIDRVFLPRPQGALPAIAVGNRHPEVSLPAAFAAFREILTRTGRNLASTVQLSATREMTTDEALAARDGETPTAAGHTRVSIRHLYHAGLWAAIRAGWREGYTAEADHFIITGQTAEEIAHSVELAKEAIRHAAGYTKFTTDTSRLFLLEADPRHPAPWPLAAVEEQFQRLFSADEQSWILGEFTKPFACGETTYRLSREEVLRLAVKFGPSLKLNEELYDTIRGCTRAFDFEPSIDEAETLTTPEEMIFYIEWLRARGRPAQLVPPNLGFKKRQAYPETSAGLERYAAHKMWPELLPRTGRDFQGNPLAELAWRVRGLADVARYFSATLSIHSGSGKQAGVLEIIGAATGGRVNYKISGELQLQLFDVLAEQPPESPWRRLFERMVARCNRFAAQGAFGEESELAARYPTPYLGDAARGRTDGNLFLVFWLGNMVGSRDVEAPDGDTRFFKEKLDELPLPLVEEVRRRNSRYIQWLASHLQG